MIHGGDIYTHKLKTGIMPLDFSANINPFGMPHSVKNAIINSVDMLEHYPDIECRELNKAVAQKESIKEEYIIFGNGAADIIYKIAFSLKPKKALVFAPTFFEYEAALSLQNCTVNYYSLLPDNDFEPKEDYMSKIKGHDIVFICNPNNPTGNVVSREFIEKVAQECEKHGVLLVIDECFIDFTKKERELTAKPLLLNYNNIIVLKAFTKMYAIAGLRLGYCMCSNINLLRQINKAGQPWSVSVAAQVAGVAACSEVHFVNKTVNLIEIERKFLSEELSKYTDKVYTSYTNFLLFKADENLAKRLKINNILIRECGNYHGLNDTFYRTAVRGHEENERLIGAIKNG